MIGASLSLVSTASRSFLLRYLWMRHAHAKAGSAATDIVACPQACGKPVSIVALLWVSVFPNLAETGL